MICKKLAYGCVLAFLSCGLSACYSFVGTNLSPKVKSLQIDAFPNNASNVNPDLSPKLTAALRDYFQSNSALSLKNEDGDILIEGEITNYQTSPAANSAGDQAVQTELSVTVKVRYFNKYDEGQNFEKSYTESENFDRSQSLLDVEPKLLEAIDKRLAIRIFNDTLANW